MTLSAAAIAALVVLAGVGWLFGYALRPQRQAEPSPRDLEPYRPADRDAFGDFPSSHDLRGRR